jgi:four helix bundle protein
VSIPSNVAEGAGRGGDREFGQYIRGASGSARELVAQLLIASDVGYLDPVTLRRLEEDFAVIRGKLRVLERSLISEIRDTR